jgi:hypothetical protein
MDELLLRALAAAARTFADEIEQGLAPRPADSGDGTESMFEVLGSIARINDEQGRGASDDEVRVIAKRAGMDPRGLAGYYSAGFLEKRPDGRWLCPDGRKRLGRLLAMRGVVILGPHQAGPQADPQTGPQAGPQAGHE